MNRDARVAVVGSFAVGLTMRLARFPTSGETLLGSGYRMDHGGKGSNQAVGCARLGARVSFVACIGRDSLAEMAVELYRNEGVDTAGLRQVPDLPTGVGFIMVNSGTGENCIVLDPGANERLNREAVLASDGILSSAQVVLAQLETPVEAAEAAMERGRAHGAITILNPAPARVLPDSLLRTVDVLTPNQSEAKVMLGRKPDAHVAPKDLARELLARGPVQVVVTLGEHGAFIATRDLEKHIPAVKMSAVDTTGAGDAFNAGLAVALARGASLEDAVILAVVTGGMAVTKEGVIPALPHQDEVLGYYRHNARPAPQWLASTRETSAH